MLPSAFPDGVGTSDDNDFRAQYPACAYPCQRSTVSLATDGVWLRVGMARYAFPVRLFHPLHSARFTGAFQQSLPYPYLALQVRADDVDARFKRALEAGATQFHPLADTAWGDRAGQFIDPFGHRWGLYRHDRDVPSEEVGRVVAKMFGTPT